MTLLNNFIGNITFSMTQTREVFLELVSIICKENQNNFSQVKIFYMTRDKLTLFAGILNYSYFYDMRSYYTLKITVLQKNRLELFNNGDFRYTI